MKGGGRRVGVQFTTLQILHVYYPVQPGGNTLFIMIILCDYVQEDAYSCPTLTLNICLFDSISFFSCEISMVFLNKISPIRRSYTNFLSKFSFSFTFKISNVIFLICNVRAKAFLMYLFLIEFSLFSLYFL